MTNAVFCLAAALLTAPAGPTAGRLRALAGKRGPWLWRQPVSVENAALLLAPIGAVCGGIGGLVAGAIAGATLRLRLRRSRLRREHAAERRHLLDGLEILVADLRAGAHPAAAADAAARECAGAAARAFAVGAARSRLGGSAADGLRREACVIVTELDRIADAWGVADRHGLALAELLDATRADLAARIGFAARTEASLAGARATAAVLAGLPVLGIALGQLMGAAPLLVLFGGGLGASLLIVGTGLACAGLLWSDAITTRVLA
ncbi:MAG TPA: hypothetical protein VIW24_28545 [Aldersonia sp.]